ncbi:MAG: M28 family peptidase [Anaerolineae bacterium]|nr:M28 family peptidase [Anaerolineae bacterium]
MNLSQLEQTILGDVWTSTWLWDTLTALCDDGHGRFAGTDDERRAGEFMLRRFAEWGLHNVRAEPFDMPGWIRGPAQLTLLDGTTGPELPCMTLAGSPDGEVEAEIIDLGPGTPEAFGRLGASIRGKIVLTGAAGPHRLERYARACEYGAVGFIFANNRPGQLIPAGSINFNDGPAPLPGIGIALEGAALLQRQLERGPVRARLRAKGENETVQARNIVADLPGTDRDAGWIVVCGHYDGHDIAQGAQDNATGTALVLETARLLRPLCDWLKASFRFILFSGEEMGLYGSKHYVQAHTDELSGIRLVFNADIVGLAAPLVLMVQNSQPLADSLNALPRNALDIQVSGPQLVHYSDHYPFVQAGDVPALMAVTSSPGEGRGWAHTQADTLDKLELRPLREAVAAAARVLLRLAVEPEHLPNKSG